MASKNTHTRLKHRTNLRKQRIVALKSLLVNIIMCTILGFSWQADFLFVQPSQQFKVELLI